ncbi:MAG: Holliday junction branch migration protein RuvA, partial [Fimbriimonadaceae bacterium]|nr:Holliday junction branch migration protein RuvA [Alphaproteobacteria bacterium]
GDEWVIIDVNGVGYHVTCSTRTLTSLPPIGEAAMIAIETYVREDQFRLFGFASELERDWFRILMTVQGVGAKVALAILSTLSPGDLASAIAMQDKATVARTSGVGPKMATRIVTELKDKAPAFSLGDGGLANLDDRLLPGGGAAADAVSALVNLGYQQGRAGAAVAKGIRDLGEGATTEALIRTGLKELAQ